MKHWRLALLGTVVVGSVWAAGCGSNSGKKAVRDGDGGDAGNAGNAASAGNGGEGNAVPGAGAAGEHSSTNAGAANGAAGEPSGNGGRGTATELTSCDEPLVIDDLPEASIAPNQPTIWQAPGGLTLITWLEGQFRKGRVLNDDDSLGDVMTFPIINNSSDQVPHYVASAPGRLLYVDRERNSLIFYDAQNDAWLDPEVHAGVYFDIAQFLANGDSLHFITDATGATGSRQVRSSAGVWGAAVPAWSIGPDRIYAPELMINAQDEGALVAARIPNSPELLGWVIRGGEVVAEASVAMGGVATSLDSALLPNGDVLAVYAHAGDAITRTSTLSYDAANNRASWSTPVPLIQSASQVVGLSVDSRGDATLSYGVGLTDVARRRIDGLWGEPTTLPMSDRWWSDPVVDGRDTTFIARTNDDGTFVIISSAAGESTWSMPLDIKRDFGWKFPQRPRMGLHSSGHPMVVWHGTNAAGGSDILLSVCR